MGSGKSTIATYLRDNYDYHIFSLGEKIHQECKFFNKHDREHMQKYGQSMREIFNEFIWCDYVINKANNLGIKERICIEDGRQLNEYNYFTNKNYLTIGVNIEDHIRLERLQKRIDYEFDPKTLIHETELQAQQCVDRCNITIFNNRDENTLYEQIDYWLKYIFGNTK